MQFHWLADRTELCNRFDNITPFTHSKLANTCNCSSEPLKLCPIPLKVYSNTKKCNQCDYNSFLTFKVWKHVQLFPCWQAEPRYCQLVSSSDCYFHLFLIPDPLLGGCQSRLSICQTRPKYQQILRRCLLSSRTSRVNGVLQSPRSGISMTFTFTWQTRAYSVPAISTSVTAAPFTHFKLGSTRICSCCGMTY